MHALQEQQHRHGQWKIQRPAVLHPRPKLLLRFPQQIKLCMYSLPHPKWPHTNVHMIPLLLPWLTYISCKCFNDSSSPTYTMIDAQMSAAFSLLFLHFVLNCLQIPLFGRLFRQKMPIKNFFATKYILWAIQGQSTEEKGNMFEMTTIFQTLEIRHLTPWRQGLVDTHIKSWFPFDETNKNITQFLLQ